MDQSTQRTNAMGNALSTPTHPHTDDTSFDFGRTPAGTGNTFPVGSVEPSTSTITRNHISSLFQQASACYANMDSCTFTHDNEVETSTVTFSTENNDSLTMSLELDNLDPFENVDEDELPLDEISPSFPDVNYLSPSLLFDFANHEPTKQQSHQSMNWEPGPQIQQAYQNIMEPGINDTILPQKYSVCTLGESSRATHAGNTIGTAPFSTSTIQSNSMPRMSSREQPAQSASIPPYTSSYRTHLAEGIHQASTSQSNDFTMEQPVTNIEEASRKRKYENRTSVTEQRWANSMVYDDDSCIDYKIPSKCT